MNKLQWNFKQNSYILIQENAFENVVCEMAAILSQPHCVKWVISPRARGWSPEYLCKQDQLDRSDDAIV